VKIGALSVCTTASPGEKASDHFTPFEAVNASDFVMFPIRSVNLVGWLASLNRYGFGKSPVSVWREIRRFVFDV
jgi:hypothetical protein